MREDRLALAQGQERRARTDEPARGDEELELGRAAQRLHVSELSAPATEVLDDLARVVAGDLDRGALDGLAVPAVDLLDQHVGLADAELVPLAAHVLDQHAEVHDAAPLDLEGLRRAGRGQLQGDVPQAGLLEPRQQVPAGHVATLLARERGVVDLEDHRDGRLVDADRRQRLGVLEVGQRVTHGQVLDAGDDRDVAGRDLLGRHALESLVAEERLDGDGERALALRVAQRHAHPDAEHAAVDASRAQPSDEVVVVDRRGLEAHRSVEVRRRSGDLAQDQLEQLEQVAAALRTHGLARRPAVAPRTVEHRELELLVVRAELDEQVEHLVEDLLGPRVRSVDLVDHDQRREPGLERLAQDEARLRHRTLVGVDEQEHRVGHGERALDLPAEVRVAGGVDDVDPRVLELDRGVLGQDRDAALALLILAVHGAFGRDLPGAEGSREAEHRVDERGLAVVDVGHDGQVADGGRHDSAPAGRTLWMRSRR